jgi:uncharacterized protein YcbK (DUF882 family)
MTDYSTDLDPLRDLLDEWGVRYFSAEELTSLHNPAWDGPDHVCPSSADLRHMHRTVQIADVLRHCYGSALRVVSGYRPPAYNDLVGGAPGSKHKAFRALDLQPYDGDIDRLIDIARPTMDALSCAGWSTGLGLYDTFIHIDIGAEGDTYRRWDNRG